MEALFELVRPFWVVWLLAVFAGIVAWAFWPGNRDHFREQAYIPLRDEEGDPSDAH